VELPCAGAVVSAQWTVSHLTSAMGVELHLSFHDVWPHPRCVQEWAHHQQDDCMRPPEPDDFVETATQLAEVLAASAPLIDTAQFLNSTTPSAT
jgi:hypothetical protein